MKVLRPGQVFFDYGPVSMVVTASKSESDDTKLCFSAFSVIDHCLRELRPTLPILRCYPPNVDASKLSGIAAGMADAVLKTKDPWLTPMAAVAGSISDAVADFLQEKGALKATANNGGDIALRLSPGETLKLGVLYDMSKPGGVNQVIRLTHEHGIGGVATSGLGGRGLTMGIASGVTTFSPRCADADALATLLANRSRIDSPAVKSCLARTLDPDSDIADLPVVLSVGELTSAEKNRALEQVLAEAEIQYRKGTLLACIATVQERTVCFDPAHLLSESETKL